jgi:hypothetical protein
MADFSSSGPSNPFNSSRSGSSNPFAGPSVAVIRDVPILERVPIKLSHTAANFFAWNTYFGLLFHEYDLLDHIDGTVDLLAMPHDPDWSTIDATIIRWFFQTISTNIFHTVVRDGDTARDLWKKITGLFTDNKIQRITFLQQEFFGLHQNNLSLDAFCLRLKTLSDELRDLEFPITDALLLSTLATGLGEDLSHAASNLTLLTTPTYEQAVAYLRNEERRLKHLRAHAAQTAFVAGLCAHALADTSRHGSLLPALAAAHRLLGQRKQRPSQWRGAPRAPAPLATGGNGGNGGNSGNGGNGGRQRRCGHGGNGGQRNGNPPPP